jgi:hypothetical protein
MVTYVGDTGTESPSSTIPQIETYTGSAWQTPYGMTLIGKLDFTSVSSWAINNIFTSTYANYYVAMSITSVSSNCSIGLRLGTTGTPVSSAIYNGGGYYSANDSNAGAFVGATYTYLNVGSGDAGKEHFSQAVIFSPQLATRTGYFSEGNISGSTGYAYKYGGNTTTTTAYTDLSSFVSSGNISGTVRVYGYRNA